MISRRSHFNPVITGLVGALVVSSYKWGYFVFGCVALVYIVYQLVWESRRHAKLFGRDVERTFLMCGSLTSFLWILYPVAWGLCEGGNVIAPDSEAVFYGILDFLAKPVFGALLIWGHRNIDPARLGLSIKDYGDADAVVHEKRGPAVHPVRSNPPMHTYIARASLLTMPRRDPSTTILPLSMSQFKRHSKATGIHKESKIKFSGQIIRRFCLRIVRIRIYI